MGEGEGDLPRKSVRRVFVLKKLRSRRIGRLENHSGTDVELKHSLKPAATVKAKFRFAIWSQTGSKLVADLLARAR